MGLVCGSQKREREKEETREREGEREWGRSLYQTRYSRVFSLSIFRTCSRSFSRFALLVPHVYSSTPSITHFRFAGPETLR